MKTTKFTPESAAAYIERIASGFRAHAAYVAATEAFFSASTRAKVGRASPAADQPERDALAVSTGAALAALPRGLNPETLTNAQYGDLADAGSLAPAAAAELEAESAALFPGLFA